MFKIKISIPSENLGLPYLVCKNIRTFNGCSVRTEALWCRTVFSSHRTTIIDSFLLHTLSLTIVFKLEYALFYHFYTKISSFSIKKCRYDVLTSCMRSSYTPWYKTEISRTGENHGKPCRVCKNKSLLDDQGIVPTPHLVTDIFLI